MFYWMTGAMPSFQTLGCQNFSKKMKKPIQFAERSITLVFFSVNKNLAPEIINRKGHDFTVDWWSLGILTFEILYGVPPWHSKNERILLRAILTGNLVF
jgi:serine/threonine protein kinase